MIPGRLVLAPLLVCVLAACGENVQTIPVGSAKKVDGQSFQLKDNGYVAPGWTPGDATSWNKQLANRAQGQNDYAPRK